jgi:hypothetical protein
VHPRGWRGRRAAARRVWRVHIPREQTQDGYASGSRHPAPPPENSALKCRAFRESMDTRGRPQGGVTHRRCGGRHSDERPPPLDTAKRGRA